MHPEIAFQLLGRLTLRHGLDLDESIDAVARHDRRETGPHTDLISREAAALVDDFTASYRDLVESLTPLVRDVTAAMAAFCAALQEQAHASTRAAATGHHDRPAWASPYGPPPRRHAP